MTRKKIHIDELFRNGLRNLSLFVSNKDLEAIDDKKSRFRDTPEETEKNTPFSDFELEVTEADWLATRAKLDAEKAVMAQDNIFAKGLSDFELEVPPGDWSETYRRYREARRRRRFLWTGTGLLLLLATLTTLFVLLPSGDKELKSTGRVAVQSAPGQIPLNTGGQGQDNARSGSAKDAAAETGSAPAPVTAGDDASGAGNKQNGTAVKDKPIRNNTAGNSNRTPVAQEEIRPGDAGSAKPGSTQAVQSPAEGGVKEDKVKVSQQEVKEQPLATENEAPAIHNTASADIRKFPFRSIGDSTISQKPVAALPKDTPVQNTTPGKGKTPPYTGPGFYAAFTSVFSYAYRELSSSNNALYNQVRNNGEKPNLHISAGIEFGMTLGSNRFSTGLQTAEQRYATHYKYSYRVYDSLPVWNPGRTRIIGYFLVRGRDTSINEKNEIRIRTVNVPLEYSRMFRVNKNTNVLAGAGMLMSWNAGSSGSKILNPVNNQLYAYAGFRQYERNFNVSPTLQVAVQNRLKGNLWLETGFSGSRALYSRFTPEFQAKEFDYRAGINIKIIYMLK